MPGIECCKTCRYFKPDHVPALADLQGSCLRRSPRLPMHGTGALWPTVGVNNWCGKFRLLTGAIPAPPGDREA